MNCVLEGRQAVGDVESGRRGLEGQGHGASPGHYTHATSVAVREEAQGSGAKRAESQVVPDMAEVVEALEQARREPVENILKRR